MREDFYSNCRFFGLLAFALLAGTVSRPVQAHFDFAAFGGARSVPLGVGLGGVGGYNVALWGDPPSSTAGGNRAPLNPWYGFLRGSVRAQTSIFVQSSELRLDLHPVSFFGLSLGTNPSYRLRDFSSVDCAVLRCQGSLTRNFLRHNGGLAYKSAFVAWTLRYDWLSQSESRAFYDESSALVSGGAQDELGSVELATGFSLLDAHVLGIQGAQQRMIGSQTKSTQYGVFYQLKHNSWRWTVGAGIYESAIQSKSPTFFTTVRRVFSSSMDPL